MLLTVSLSALAEECLFVVWTKFGEKISYPFTECPKVVPTDKFLVVTTIGTTVEYLMSDVSKFTLETSELGNVDGGEKTNICNLSHQGGLVRLSGFRVGSVVNLISTNGQLVMSERVGSDGTLSIEISELSSGIYIISTESITYKIIKR